MKRVFALMMLLALAVTMLGGCGAAGQEAEVELAEPEMIRIGIFEPFTGANSVGGKQEALGIIYAHSKEPLVEINGQPYLISLEVADNESSRDMAVTAASRLVDEGVAAVIGSFGSDEALAGSPIFEEAGIPVLGATCTNPAITVGNQHYFRICWLDTFQGAVLANFAQDSLNVGKVYCLSEMDDNYSAGLCSYFIEAFTAQGGEVVYESFPAGTTDFSPYIRSAQREGAQAFFAPISTESAMWLIEQSAEEKLGMPILAGDTWDSNVVAAAGKKNGADIYITTFFDESTQTEAGKDFVKGMQEFVNGSEDVLRMNGGNDMISAASAMGYDAYFTILEAIKNAGSADPAAIQEALWNTAYEGVTGAISFAPESGDAIRSDAYIKQVDKEYGDWNFVTVQSLD